ncbi:MAG: hypothetical protein LBV23_11135, partial [Deltaproteobacteria bacterium]|nr:hypothetical protein [Deltaproteobacteria bacterium]
YLINKNQSRLKDVVRFFIEAGMGTRAYAIIEQEKVGRLVDAPPDERRLLLDEAAGITRYKEQKKESLKRIESAEQNLTTISAMISESKKQLAVVSRAAAKASRWKAMREELKTLELTLAAKKHLSFTENLEGLRAQSIENQKAISLLEAKQRQAELEIDDIRLKENQLGQSLEEQLGLWHNRKNSFDQLSLELDHLLDGNQNASERVLRVKEESEGLNEENERYLSDKVNLEANIEQLTKESEEAEETRNEIREEWLILKNDCERLALLTNQVKKQYEEAKDKQRKLRENLAGTESLYQHFLGRLKSLELEDNQAEQTLSEAKDKLAARERFKKGLADELTQAVEQVSLKKQDSAQARFELERQVKRLGEAEKKTATLSTKFETLENLKDGGFGWYPKGVKALLKDDEIPGLLGPVAENISVPDGYEAAAEAFLGERLGWILVEDRVAGLKALKAAREKNLGRCALLAKDSLANSDLTRALLGPIKVCESLGEEVLDDNKSSFLSKEGDFIGQGFLAGGNEAKSDQDQKNKGSGLLGRLKELEAVKKELNLAEAVAAAVKRELDTVRELSVQADEALAAAESQKNSLAADLSAAESKILLASSEVNGLAIRKDSLASEIAKTEADSAVCLKKKGEAEAQIQDLVNEVAFLEEQWREAAANSEGRAGDLDELRERGQAAASNADSLSERLEGLKREQARVCLWLDNLAERRLKLTSLFEELSEQINGAESRRKEIEAQLEGTPELLAQDENKVASYREQIAQARSQLSLKEDIMRDINQKRDEEARELSRIEREIAENYYGLKKINSDLLKDWQIVFFDPLRPDSEFDEPTENPPSQDVLTENYWEEEEEEEEEEGGEEEEEEDFGIESSNQQSSEAQSLELTENDGNLNQDINTLKSVEQGLSQDSNTLEENQELLPPNKQNDFDIAVSSAPKRLDPNEIASGNIPAEAEETIQKLRERLLSLGDINPAAIEEEEELKKKLDYQQTQYDDLITAINHLKTSINRINQTCRQRFNQTFNQANQKFRELFPILFEGGEGWLTLTQDNDPLESGVEIHVHPPGKKITVMRSLSGGEKTLTSLCLIFALYLIKPSPFCLLDEADAPLDEANIDRFNRLLRSLSEASQIIMVTHNKRTMQISDTLYGVTMETPGVSRLVSVNLDEAEELKNA